MQRRQQPNDERATRDAEQQGAQGARGRATVATQELQPVEACKRCRLQFLPALWACPCLFIYRFGSCLREPLMRFHCSHAASNSCCCCCCCCQCLPLPLPLQLLLRVKNWWTYVLAAGSATTAPAALLAPSQPHPGTTGKLENWGERGKTERLSTRASFQFLT